MLFLIHGWAANADIWPSWLKTDGTYIYQSPIFPEYKHLEEEFLRVYRSCSNKLTLVGWSLGGMLSLQLAANHPQKVERVILISSTPRFTLSEGYCAGLPASIVKNLSRKLSYKKQRTLLEFYKIMFSPYEEDFLKNFIQNMFPKLTDIELISLQNGLSYLLEVDLRELLPRVKTACSIIHGTEDVICPPEAANYLKEQLPNSTLTVIQGAGHIPFITRPDIVEQVLFNNSSKENC
ncbi:alpha/beta fold hydrolase [Dendrosporobacter sp. 1207_IL3150]|uniref:alpha/beta fold hydrolase n=1 Tax=Dendrosporobacter sp. 1207_IL3150 TaxID=3084054 RepID=UPI002FDB1CAA